MMSDVEHLFICLLAMSSLEKLDTLSLTKEARICDGEKTISLTSDGKTGQPLVKD